MPRFDVGIDPGVNTGVALWDILMQRLDSVQTMMAADALCQVQLMAGHQSIRTVIFEDARLRKWFGSKGREALQGAGSIKRDCQIWEEWLTLHRIPFKAVAPQAGATKWSSEQFQKVTGWQGRTSEHARDAALLVYGRKDKP